MIRKLILASAIALGTAGLAQAQSAVQITGGGDNLEITYASAPRNVVGGGEVALSGGGVNRSYSYRALRAQPGLAATLQGGGDNAQLIYGSGAPAAGFAQAAGLAPRG